MPKRKSTLPRSFTMFAALLLLVVAPLVAASDGEDVPRRPDGRPDLSGTYDTATLTPFVRPQHYGDRLALSDEEAQAIAEHWRKNFEKDYQPSDPDREAPPEGGVGIYAPEFTGAAGKVGGYNAFFVDIGEGTFKLDGEWRTSILTSPANGQMPPLSAAGKAKRAAVAPYRHENTGTAWWLEKPGLDFGPYDDPELRPLAERCLLARGAAGPPARPAMYNNIKRIVQTDDHVLIHVEWMHDTRIIHLSDVDPYDLPPRWLGNSVGHWEGDTLVVRTANFLSKGGVTSTFAPGLEAVERWSRIDGNTLRYQFTINDPNYAAPYSGEYPWPATDKKMYEYACHEGNYALGGILRGARLLEREAQE